jgi:ribonuclease HII
MENSYHDLSPFQGRDSISSEVFPREKLLVAEKVLREQGYQWIAGVDEAGRGPLAGPVVAAACILPKDFDLPGLNDSKKVSELRREKLAVEIQVQAVAWSLACIDSTEIDEINILQASLKAMSHAVARLTTLPAALLIDGRDTLDTLDLKNIFQQALVGGDGLSASIAAASILAKVERDRIMRAYSEVYPAYGFDKHKGYGTKEHMDVLGQLGPCPIHRMSFAPVKRAYADMLRKV